MIDFNSIVSERNAQLLDELIVPTFIMAAGYAPFLSENDFAKKFAAPKHEEWENNPFPKNIFHFLKSKRETDLLETQRLLSENGTEGNDKDAIFDALAAFEIDYIDAETFKEASRKLLAVSLRSNNPTVRAAALRVASQCYKDIKQQLTWRFNWFFSKNRMLSPECRAILAFIRDDYFNRPNMIITEEINRSLEEVSVETKATERSQRKAFTRHTLLIHGTHFPALPEPEWHIVGSDFYNYLKPLHHPLFSGGYFEWEGNLSRRSRNIAAGYMTTWVEQKKIYNLNLICHSHGGNVAFLFSQKANLKSKTDKLICLSTPFDHRVWKNEKCYKELYVIYCPYDFVVFAQGIRGDFSPLPFPGLQFEPIRLNEYFSHTASRDLKIWNKYGIAQAVGLATPPSP